MHGGGGTGGALINETNNFQIRKSRYFGARVGSCWIRPVTRTQIITSSNVFLVARTTKTNNHSNIAIIFKYH